MAQVEDGRAEVEAWETETRNGEAYASIRRFGRNGTERREMVLVTGIPSEVA
jgi:hypothetical protein